MKLVLPHWFTNPQVRVVGSNVFEGDWRGGGCVGADGEGECMEVSAELREKAIIPERWMDRPISTSPSLTTKSVLDSRNVSLSVSLDFSYKGCKAVKAGIQCAGVVVGYRGAWEGWRH